MWAGLRYFIYEEQFAGEAWEGPIENEVLNGFVREASWGRGAADDKD